MEDKKVTAEWLQSVGINVDASKIYAGQFAKHAVSMSHIQYLDHDLLKEIGIISVGNRLRILEHATGDYKIFYSTIVCKQLTF